MNVDIEHLEKRISNALGVVASEIPEEPPLSFSDEVMRRRDAIGRHRSRPLRSLIPVGVAAIGLAAICVAILGGLGTSSSPRKGTALPSSVQPAKAPPQTTVPPNLIHYQVAGYTQSQASAAAAACLSASGADGEEGASLRATFSDPSGSTLVVTTASGWNTCNQSADGTVLETNPFERYTQAQGWGSGSSPPPLDGLSASWLTAPVELDSYGGGYLSRSTTADGWLDVAVGRVASNIVKVSVQMPGGSVVSASVENGFFVVRQLLPSQPSFSASGTVPMLGYADSGALVFNSLTSPSALPPQYTPNWQPPCFITPTGLPVTPPGSPGQKCLTAIAW